MATRDELLKALRDGSISRREFIYRMGSIGVSAAALPSLLSAAAHAAPGRVGIPYTPGDRTRRAHAKCLFPLGPARGARKLHRHLRGAWTRARRGPDRRPARRSAH